MNREEIIRMAQEAGFVVDDLARQHQPNCITHTWHMIDEGLARFAALVAAAERETCARIADEIGDDDEDCHAWTAADAIRAREADGSD